MMVHIMMVAMTDMMIAKNIANNGSVINNASNGKEIASVSSGNVTANGNNGKEIVNVNSGNVIVIANINNLNMSVKKP
jgi:hypothetical protein